MSDSETKVINSSVTSSLRMSPSRQNIKAESVERPPSPETNCAICLEELRNKSYTNTCLHQFCFHCLLEWSKVRSIWFNQFLLLWCNSKISFLFLCSVGVEHGVLKMKSFAVVIQCHKLCRHLCSCFPLQYFFWQTVLTGMMCRYYCSFARLDRLQYQNGNLIFYDFIVTARIYFSFLSGFFLLILLRVYQFGV